MSLTPLSALSPVDGRYASRCAEFGAGTCTGTGGAGNEANACTDGVCNADGECTAGNFVWRRPGSVHRAWSPNGCIGIGIFERPNEFLEEPDRS